MDGALFIQETRVPFGVLVPSLWSGNAGDEFLVTRQQHTIDSLFDFNVDDGAALPSGTKNWTILRPRKPGLITQFQVWFADTGTTGTANTFDLLKNGVTILTAVVSFTHADADNTMKSGTLTVAAGVAFAADDRLSIQTVKGTNDGVGPKARTLGYYIGA